MLKKTDILLLKMLLKLPLSISLKLLKYDNVKNQMFSMLLREFYQLKFNITIGYGTYGGCFWLDNILPPNIVFGNYCSIAPTIRIFRANHPNKYFTTHPILYNPVVGLVEKDTLHRPQLLIGHDVWIGEGTIITPKVINIGNGAIIGAGSVVTKDVPPYAVVAGNPARIIKMRFSEEIILNIESTKWWDLISSELFMKKDELQKLIGQ